MYNCLICILRKSSIKIGTEVTLKIPSNNLCDSHDENINPYKLLLPITQGLRLCEASAKGFSANIKLSKTQLHKIG